MLRLPLPEAQPLKPPAKAIVPNPCKLGSFAATDFSYRSALLLTFMVENSDFVLVKARIEAVS
ncbi:MAG: hypothetical protein LW716_10045 [Microcystis sp. 53602_E8]|nr:hypothetical protein [Microcystis sp. 53602_E8]